ncbi:MAG: hypothetical protein ACLQAT_04900 [Candidatus Binataceae bacterium]
MDAGSHAAPVDIGLRARRLTNRDHFNSPDMTGRNSTYSNNRR